MYALHLLRSLWFAMQQQQLVYWDIEIIYIYVWVHKRYSIYITRDRRQFTLKFAASLHAHTCHICCNVSMSVAFDCPNRLYVQRELAYLSTSFTKCFVHSLAYNKHTRCSNNASTNNSCSCNSVDSCNMACNTSSSFGSACLHARSRTLTRYWKLPTLQQQ